MKLRDPLLRGVYAFGFSTPSAIQQRAIMPITQGGCQGQGCRVATSLRLLFPPASHAMQLNTAATPGQ